jgi:hypothetical protein
VAGIQKHIASSGPRLIPLWSGKDLVTPSPLGGASDAYGSVISIFVAYGCQEPHELAVNMTTVGGLWVQQIALLEPGSHESERVTGTGTAAVEITPDIAPVLAAVDELEGEFRDAFDDDRRWAPASRR